MRLPAGGHTASTTANTTDFNSTEPFGQIRRILGWTDLLRHKHHQRQPAETQTQGQPGVDAQQAEALMAGTNWTAARVPGPSSLHLTSFGGTSKCGAWVLDVLLAPD